MTGAHFLSISKIDHVLRHRPSHLVEIALELRSLVSSVAPNATERILMNGLGYHDEARGGPVKGGICQIWLFRDHVRLYFIHGAFLDDPDSLLQGDRQYKRFVRVDLFDSAPWDSLKELIHSSAKFDPTTLKDFPAPRDER